MEAEERMSCKFERVCWSLARWPDWPHMSSVRLKRVRASYALARAHTSTWWWTHTLTHVITPSLPSTLSVFQATLHMTEKPKRAS